MTLGFALLAAASAQAPPDTVALTPPDPTAGAALYDRSCVACHGEDGEGSSALRAVNVRPRSFGNPKVMRRLSDGELATAITGGGTAVGRSPLMPAWGGVLTESEVRDVIAYIRTLSTVVAEFDGTLVAEAPAEP